MKKTIHWGILACGRIAHAFAKALRQVDGCELSAVASRDEKRVRDFAQAYGVATAYTDYDALLRDESLDAIYIATPHPFHFEWVLKALRAGKQVLCEKPLTMNFRQADEAFRVARETDTLLREAFMYRHHPQTEKLAELIASGVIGEVRMLEASFCVNTGINPESRLQAKALGGGAILDLGCYPLSFVRLAAGKAMGLPFAEPLSLKAMGHLDPDLDTDMWTNAILQFDHHIHARISAAVRVQMERFGGAIYGDKGRIFVEMAWHCREHMRLEVNGKDPQIIPADTSRELFSYEIESFVREMRGEPAPAGAVGMGEADTLGNLRALDLWRSEIGLQYPADTDA